MENKMNFTKAILLLISGTISVAISYLLGLKSDFNGFLIGYGYTALAGGLVGMIYSYYKNQKAKKVDAAQ